MSEVEEREREDEEEGEERQNKRKTFGRCITLCTEETTETTYNWNTRFFFVLRKTKHATYLSECYQRTSPQRQQGGHPEQSL